MGLSKVKVQVPRFYVGNLVLKVFKAIEAIAGSLAYESESSFASARSR